MLDHFNLPVSNLSKSVAFYQKVLKPLHMTLLVEEEGAVGFGESTWDFGLEETAESFPVIHLAFKAGSHQAVRDFYAAALDAGGRDNGEPGVREHYGQNYYATYILDPDNHNIEAVCRTKEQTV